MKLAENSDSESHVKKLNPTSRTIIPFELFEPNSKIRIQIPVQLISTVLKSSHVYWFFQN